MEHRWLLRIAQRDRRVRIGPVRACGMEAPEASGSIRAKADVWCSLVADRSVNLSTEVDRTADRCLEFFYAATSAQIQHSRLAE